MISKLAQAAGISYQGKDVPFQGFSIDSRTLQPGQCFVAIQDKRDGHTFIPEALQKGASALVITHFIPNLSVPQMVVQNTDEALGKLSHAHRQQFSIPVIGITGSSGKTSVKNFTAALLTPTHTPLVAIKNFNSHWGLPLVLSTLKPHHTVAVLEMGACAPGEIGYLANIAEPTVGLITTVNPCHIEKFGSVETIAKTKGELYQKLKPGSQAFLNQANPFFPLWKDMAAHCQIITFGQTGSDFHARNITLAFDSSTFELVTPMGTVPISLPLPGLHNIQNAVAASGLVWTQGVSLSEIQQRLSRLTFSDRRLQVKTLSPTCTLIDDSYNASPTTFAIALEVLAQYPGRKIVFMGDMGELKPEEQVSLHAGIGQKANALGIEAFYGVGPLSKTACLAFGKKAEHFATQAELIQNIPRLVSEEPVVCLVKGSRFTSMDVVADAIQSLKETSHDTV
jgi:UDP-N-acetylmuramoyl-tripeptide--D-alanyl-D-alanine ligase